MRRHRQHGFTLIELMISLLVSSLLTFMILSIFTKMSSAYREQQQVVQVQQVITAARAALDQDAKLAGLYMAQGFTLPADWDAGQQVRRSPIRIVNHADGPDELGFYYADAETLAIVTDAVAPTRTRVALDENPGLVVGDRVVMSTPRLVASRIDATNDGKIMQYDACILEISAISGTTLTFASHAGNLHCGAPIPATPYPGPQGGTIVAKLVSHYWRIDRSSASRIELGALQLDTTGALGGIVDTNFADMAYGIVDLQVATRFYDGDGSDTADPDTDGDREWESGDGQETATDPIAVASSFRAPLLMSISVLARTTTSMKGVVTAATPSFTASGNTDHNTIGDRPSESLPSPTDAALVGNRVYRYTTFQVDLRNTGIGQ